MRTIHPFSKRGTTKGRGPRVPRPSARGALTASPGSGPRGPQNLARRPRGTRHRAHRPRRCHPCRPARRRLERRQHGGTVAMTVPTIQRMSLVSRFAISARTSARPALNWSEVTWSPCSRPPVVRSIRSSWPDRRKVRRVHPHRRRRSLAHRHADQCRGTRLAPSSPSLDFHHRLLIIQPPRPGTPGAATTRRTRGRRCPARSVR